MTDCIFKDMPERTGLYQGEFFCKTHEGYTIYGNCPREGEKVDTSTIEGLARLIDPGAWPTVEQIEIHSACYTGWPPNQMFKRCQMDYESRQRRAIKSASNVMRNLTDSKVMI